MSVKKLRQGDACWSTQKALLGWDMDTVAGTRRPPPHCLNRLYTLLNAFPPTCKRVPIAEWRQLLVGKLRSALPGALFSMLQDALRHRIHLTSHVFESLNNFRAIADSLQDCPTRFRKLVPVAPHSQWARAMHPIAAWAVCGTFPKGRPVVWRLAFPPAIQRSLVTSSTNRPGTVLISDLERTGTLAHKHVLAHLDPGSTAKRPIWLAAGNNRAFLAWATKGSTTVSTACAYLLWLNALHQ